MMMIKLLLLRNVYGPQSVINETNVNASTLSELKEALSAWLSYYIVIKKSKNANLLLKLECKSLMKTFTNVWVQQCHLLMTK